VAVLLAVTVPFLDKPFTIDDAAYLMVTEHILDDPLRPFDFKLNWYDAPEPAWTINSPPGYQYLTAAVMLAVGPSEVAMHVVAGGFVVLGAAATWFLAKRVTGWATLAALIYLASPVITAGTNVMLDVPMVGLWTAALACHVAGVERDKKWLVFAGGAAAGAAILVKYPAVMAPLCMALYSVLRKRYRTLWFAAVPAAMVGVWCGHNLYFEGRLHMVKPHEWGAMTAMWKKFWCGLTALGGLSLIWLAFVEAGLRRRRYLVYLGIAVGVGFLGILVGPPGPYGLYGVWQPVLEAGFRASGAFMVLAVIDWAVRRMSGLLRFPFEPDRALIAVFLFSVAIVLGFNVYRPEFVAARHYLPLLPACAAFGAGLLEDIGRRAGLWFKIWVSSTVVVCLTVAVMVGLADKELAEAHRDMADYCAARFGDTAPLYFIGHWGWQWYASHAGMKLVNLKQPIIEPGAIWVVPLNVHKHAKVRPPRPRAVRLDTRVYGTWVPIRTMSRQVGASFHSSQPTQVPWKIAPSAPVEEFAIMKILPQHAGRARKRSPPGRP
jgi:hypothetical protein